MERVSATSPRGYEEMLFLRYRRKGDRATREELIRRHLPLARRLARRYEHSSEPLEDLVQVASLGLIKAIDGFDPERGVRFTSYAVPTILGELRRHFRNSAWAVHLPRRMQERTQQVADAVKSLGDELGRTPTPSQVAERLGLPVEQVLEALQARAAYATLSLDAPVGAASDEPVTLAEAMGSTDDSFELAEDRIVVGDALRTAHARERELLRLRFGDGLTQSEIADQVGISQMHVSRLLRGTLDRLSALAGAA